MLALRVYCKARACSLAYAASECSWHLLQGQAPAVIDNVMYVLITAWAQTKIDIHTCADMHACTYCTMHARVHAPTYLHAPHKNRYRHKL